MEYKENWEEVIERQTAFWNREMPDRILARIYVRNPYLDKWLEEKGKSIPIETDELPDTQDIFEMWDCKLRILRNIEDDSLPVMIPTEFDEGLYGGILGARMIYGFDPASGWFSSMAESFLDDYSDTSCLKIDESNFWFQELGRRLNLYKRLAAGKFGLSPIISIDALNFAVLSRGANLAMLDIYDNPSRLKDLFDFALEYTVRINTFQKEIIGSFKGGRFDGYAGFGSWFPGEEINISVDAFGLCSRETYEETGFEYSQKLIDEAGSAFLHIHGNAQHLLPVVTKLKGLRGIWICDEKPHPFPMLSEIKKTTGDMPLVTECMLDEFREAMRTHTLPGGVFYIIRAHKEGECVLQSPAVETVAEANELMHSIKEYRKW